MQLNENTNLDRDRIIFCNVSQLQGSLCSSAHSHCSSFCNHCHLNLKTKHNMVTYFKD